MIFFWKSIIVIFCSTCWIPHSMERSCSFWCWWWFWQCCRAHCCLGQSLMHIISMGRIMSQIWLDHFNSLLSAIIITSHITHHTSHPPHFLYTITYYYIYRCRYAMQGMRTQHWQLIVRWMVLTCVELALLLGTLSSIQTGLMVCWPNWQRYTLWMRIAIHCGW